MQSPFSRECIVHSCIPPALFLHAGLACLMDALLPQLSLVSSHALKTHMHADDEHMYDTMQNERAPVKHGKSAAKRCLNKIQVVNGPTLPELGVAYVLQAGSSLDYSQAAHC